MTDSKLLPAGEVASETAAGNELLVAEDDPLFRHTLTSWLHKWNYGVTAVENGSDAWNVLQKDNAPQMAILDWMMPGVDGLELCRRLRSREIGPYRYLLLVTAKTHKEDVVAGLEAGADDYLTKPFNAEELRARIRAGQRILHLQDALIRVQRALQFEADHDRLTGLWNRGAILELLHRERTRHQRARLPFGLAMVDLDHFKKINDSHGHLVGDRVLQESARRMGEVLRDYDWLGRYGGEEFLIVVPECDAEGLQLAAERVRRCISGRPIDTVSGAIAVTASIGTVSVPPEQAIVDDEALVRMADEALYGAKAAGRNRVQRGAPAMPADAARAAPEVGLSTSA